MMMRRMVLIGLVALLAAPVVVSAQNVVPADKALYQSPANTYLKEYEFLGSVTNENDLTNQMIMRGGKEYKIVAKGASQKVYDERSGQAYQRVLYTAKEMVQPKAPIPPKEPNGPAITVSLEYKTAPAETIVKNYKKLFMAGVEFEKKETTRPVIETFEQYKYEKP